MNRHNTIGMVMKVSGYWEVWEYGSVGVWGYGSMGMKGLNERHASNSSQYSNTSLPSTPTPPHPHTPTLPHPRTPILPYLITLLFFTTTIATAQTAPPKPQKAFAMSLVMPGWGHQYAQGGSWRGMATVYAGVDVALWAGLVNAIWQRNHLTQSFETLASTRAGADIAGKDRTFYLNLATYRSSDDYLEAQLRSRAWDRVDYVSDPSFQWSWASEEDYRAFRDLREDSETFRRRRSLFIAALVANRLLSGLSSIGAANKASASFSMSMSAYGDRPMVNVGVRF